MHRNGNIFQKSDRIDIIGGIKRDVTADFSAIERQSTKMGLAVNENKIKYMLSTSRDVRRIDSQIIADNYNFYTVNEFIYIAYAFTIKNDVWRLNVGSLLPTGATTVSTANWVGKNSLVQRI